MGKRNPKQFYLVLALLVMAGGTFAAAYLLEIGLLWAYLMSVNLLTFLMYGFDKRQAIRQGGRVPEIVLHLLALVGGSPAALAGQLTFRHKTKKRSFRFIFICTVILQIAGTGLYLYFGFIKTA